MIQLSVLILVVVLCLGFTHTFKRTWSRAGESILGQVATTADGEINIEVTVDAAGTEEVTVSIIVAQLKSLVLVSSTDTTFETNSPVDDTIELVAGKVLEWNATSGYFDNPLTVDVVTITLTNNDAETAATFKLRATYDSTI